jgi:multicomponent Na+:H+ antiporter subunit D
MIETLSELVRHPGAILIFLYFFSYLLKGNFCKYLLISSPVVSFLLMIKIFNANQMEFFYIASLLLVLFCGVLFAYTAQIRDKDNARLALLYIGAGISVIISSNLFVIFTLFEVMLIAATFMIFNGGNKLSFNAGAAYFKLHILSGVFFLIGTITHYSLYGDFTLVGHNFLDFTVSDKQILNYTILAALLINVASPPFSYWLVEGYAATTPAGSVFLSVVTTKISLIILMKFFLGLNFLICIGIFIGVYGLIYAALESNMRRIINYGIISQIGMILIAIGIGERKISEYMIITEILSIALAMMCIGSIILSLRVKRYFQIPINTKFPPVLVVCSIIAFASISAVPFTPGYVSKYLLYKSSFVVSHPWLGYGISALTAGTAFAVGIKLPVFVFIKKFYHKTKNKGTPYVMTSLRAISLKVLALSVMIFGIFPEVLLGNKIEMFDSVFFNQTSLLLGVLASFFLLGKFLIVRAKYTLLDFDWFYRFLLGAIYSYLKKYVSYIHHKMFLEGQGSFASGVKNLMGYCFGAKGMFVSMNSQRNVVLMLLFIVLVMLLSF